MSVGSAFCVIGRRSRIPLWWNLWGISTYNCLFSGGSQRVFFGILVPRYLFCGVLLLFACSPHWVVKKWGGGGPLPPCLVCRTGFSLVISRHVSLFFGLWVPTLGGGFLFWWFVVLWSLCFFLRIVEALGLFFYVLDWWDRELFIRFWCPLPLPSLRRLVFIGRYPPLGWCSLWRSDLLMGWIRCPCSLSILLGIPSMEILLDWVLIVVRAQVYDNVSEQSL